MNSEFLHQNMISAIVALSTFTLVVSVVATIVLKELESKDKKDDDTNT